MGTRESPRGRPSVRSLGRAQDVVLAACLTPGGCSPLRIVADLTGRGGLQVRAGGDGEGGGKGKGGNSCNMILLLLISLHIKMKEEL